MTDRAKCPAHKRKSQNVGQCMAWSVADNKACTQQNLMGSEEPESGKEADHADMQSST